MTGPLLCIGDLNADITISAPRGIVPGSDTAGLVRLTGGGSAANVAAWAADAGTAARFAGAVGDDPLGDWLVDELTAHGVDVRAVRHVDTTTRAIAAIVESDGDRSMVSSLDPTTVLRPADISERWFDEAVWLHLTAYTMLQDGGRATFERLIGEAADRTLAWSVDPSSVSMLAAQLGRHDALAAFDGATVIFPNRDEAAWLADVADPVAAGEALLDVAETVVVTCGTDGAVVARRGANTLRVDAVPTEVVNALGCGDAFAGGFLAGRVNGLADSASAARAALSASGAASIAASR